MPKVNQRFIVLYWSTCGKEKPPAATLIPQRPNAMVDMSPLPHRDVMASQTTFQSRLVPRFPVLEDNMCPGQQQGWGLTDPPCPARCYVLGTWALNPDRGAEGAGISVFKHRTLNAFPGNCCFHGKC